MVELREIKKVMHIRDSLLTSFVDHINGFLENGWVLLSCDSPSRFDKEYTAVVGATDMVLQGYGNAGNKKN